MILPTHRAAVRAETVVSVLVNSLVPTAIVWLLDVTPPPALLGPHGAIVGLFLGSGLATFMMSLVITQIVRRRVCVDTVPPLDVADLPAVLRLLPSNLVLRAIMLAMIALLLLVPLWSLIVTAIPLAPFTKTGLAVFNVLFGASVGLLMTPFVVLRALADQRPGATSMS